MLLQPGTRAFLQYLQANPQLRRQLRAGPDRTFLYAGSFFKPVWKEIEEFRRAHPEHANKELLPDVLRRLPANGTPFAHLLAYVQDVERQVPWKPDGFTLWRALSGIFASNAVGAVSFQIGSGVVAAQKVFAATELPILLRNPNVDATTKDLLAYYDRCIKSGQADINVGFVAAG